MMGAAFSVVTFAAGGMVAWLGVVAASRRPKGLRP
jgi:hypothetical protein